MAAQWIVATGNWFRAIPARVKAFSVGPRGRRIFRKLTKWSFFTVIVGFLSVMADVLVPWLGGQAVQVAELTAKGEPFIISLALVAGGVGDLVFDRQNNGLPSVAQGVAIGSSIVIITLAAICYGVTKLAVRDPGPVAAGTTSAFSLAVENVSSASMAILIASIVTSFSCVVISELGH